MLFSSIFPYKPSRSWDSPLSTFRSTHWANPVAQTARHLLFEAAPAQEDAPRPQAQKGLAFRQEAADFSSERPSEARDVWYCLMVMEVSMAMGVPGTPRWMVYGKIPWKEWMMTRVPPWLWDDSHQDRRGKFNSESPRESCDNCFCGYKWDDQSRKGVIIP